MPRFIVIILFVWANVYFANASVPGVTFANGDFTARYGHCMVVANKTTSAKVFVIGGITSDTMPTNDVWRSTVTPFTAYTALSTTGIFTARSHHTCVAVNDTIVVAGGRRMVGSGNGVFTSYDEGVTWITQTSIPWTARDSHAMVTDGTTTAWIYGGQNNVTGTCFNDVWKTTNYGVSWTQVTTTGTMWEPRYFLSYVYFRSKLWLYGGKDNSGNVFGDVWSSGTDGATWDFVGFFGVPSNRYAMTMATDGTDMYLFGGTVSITTANTELDDWYTSRDGRNWAQQLTANAVPFIGPRAQMAACNVGTLVLISGGYAVSGPTLYSTVYRAVGPVLGTTTNTAWAYYPSATFSPRDRAAAVTNGANLYLFGGTINDTVAGSTDEVWTTTDCVAYTSVVFTSVPFTARSSHAATAISTLGLMFVAGGLNRTGGFLDDAWLTDGSTSPLSAAARLPQPRADFGMASDGTNVFIAGGRTTGGVAIASCYYLAAASGYTVWVLATTTVGQGYIRPAMTYFSNTVISSSGRSLTGQFDVATRARTPAQLMANTPATAWTVRQAVTEFSARSGHQWGIRSSALAIIIGGQTGNGTVSTSDVWATTAASTWTLTYPLPVPSVQMTSTGVVVGGRAYGSASDLTSLTATDNVAYLGGLIPHTNRTTNEVFIYTTNVCVSWPCRNGATCLLANGVYTCQCPVGFSGTLCQTNVQECASFPCRNGGTCVDDVNGFLCTCPRGFSGVVCQTDIDECASQPCANGGTCVDTSTGKFACTCVAGYSGTLCQTQINECGSVPCQNNGTCVDAVNSFSCVCPTGYSGLLCQTQINECASVPCMNGGVCSDAVDGFVCTCASGYTGVRCQTDIDECGSAPCVVPAPNVYSFTHATSVCYTVNGDLCNPNIVMVAGTVNVIHVNVPTIHPIRIQDEYGFLGHIYNGSSQSTAISYGDILVTIPMVGYPTQLWFWCERHSGQFGNITVISPTVCVDNVGNYTCQCTPGTTGVNCQTQLNTCASAPCRGGGTCIPMLNSYICNCVTGLGGANCERKFNVTGPCASSPCQNLGQCIANATADTFTCSCTVGFSGVHCQTNINECASSPCVNGATCVDGSGYFSCVCGIGYSGARCQTDIDECGSRPCQNNGTCVDGLGSFSCQCPMGYSGLLCQTNVNECGSAPCRNGGTCVDHVGSFECTCSVGYAGTQCQTNTNECASNPCSNNGTCVDGINQYSCTCIPPSFGTRCEYADVCDAALNPCPSTQSCVIIPNYPNAVCRCPAGRSGLLCDTGLFGLGPIAGQNGWTQNSSVVIDDGIRVNASMAFRGSGVWFSTNRGVGVGQYAYRYSEPFLKTNGDPSIVQEFVTGNQFYGGDTFNTSVRFRMNNGNADGTRFVFGIDSNNTADIVFSVAVDYTRDQGLILRAGNVTTAIGTPQRYHYLEVVVTVVSDASNDVATVTLDGTVVYRGLTLREDLFPSPRPMNRAVFNFPSAIELASSFNATIPSGVWFGSFQQRAYNASVGINNNFFTTFGLMDCYANYSTNPCVSNGTCVPYADGALCVCLPGYTGTACQSDVNECSSSPCLNGGLCTDLINDFMCDCTDAYEGSRCQTLIFVPPVSSTAEPVSSTACDTNVVVVVEPASGLSTLAIILISVLGGMVGLFTLGGLMYWYKRHLPPESFSDMPLSERHPLTIDTDDNERP